MDSPHFPRIASIAKTDLLEAGPETTIREAADLMREHDLTSVIFRLDGQPHIFTVEHVLSAVHHGSDLERPIAELPIQPATTITARETVLDAMEEMEAKGTRYLAVLDDTGRMVGIVTYTDIVSTVDPVFLIEKKTVGEVVKKKELMTFSSDWILEDVLCHLVHIEDSIIVVDDGRLVGIITSKDAFRIVLSGASTNRPLSEYMSSPVITVASGTSIHEALMTIKTRGIKRVVVVDEAGQLVGVVTQSELVGFAYGYWTRLLRHHSGELRELVAMLSEKADRYRTDSLTDALTGLGNRRLLTRRMSEEVERVRRYGNDGFSLLFIDVDNFKAINDHHGHAFGDEIIKLLGKAIHSSVRSIDTVCRWGGDEFAVLAPHTDIDDATVLATRISRRVTALSFKGDAMVTVSIGLGKFVDDKREKDFFDRVDAALYAAKRSGKNRVEISKAS